MRAFLVQTGWELRKLAGRPLSYVGFVISLGFEGLVVGLLHLPAVRARIARDLWGLHLQTEDVVSGLTVAAHLMGETAAIAGTLSLALVGAEIVAGEWDSGTLRMVFCRPVSRPRLLASKFLACLAYAVGLSLFIGLTSLAAGMLCEGRGGLVMTATHESIFGQFDFATGLQRYGLAMALLAASSSCGIVLSFFFSCWRVTPAAAAVLALTVYFADDFARVRPEFAYGSPYCLSTRLLTWRQVFNDEIPWLRIARNFRVLLIFDATMLISAGLIFQRHDFKA